LGLNSLVCTGCGSLCDDIQVQIEDCRPVRIENACAKGAAHIQSSFEAERRPKSTVRGQECTLNKAIEEAKRLFLNSRNPLVFGLDGSTLSAQALAIELTQKTGGSIDSASSFSYGLLIKGILDGDVPTCSLPEIKDNADLLVYWGADPPNTHPRHLSLHSYYAYTDYNPAGWYPKVTLTCIEVRHTELSSMCRPVFRLKPGGDKAFIKTVAGEARDEVEMAEKLTELVKKARFCAVFGGLGLMHGVGSDFSSFVTMVHMLGDLTRIAVIPMVSEINMRGFCKLLHEKTGHANGVSFGGSMAGGSGHSFLEQIRKQPPECALIIGSDPFSALPHSVMRNLAATNIVCLSPFATPSTIAADVVIPTALPGVECGGSVLRMDGVEVALAELGKREYPTEETILRQLLEGV
jgi:formylmethanofuran dehydrogenase subunit B